VVKVKNSFLYFVLLFSLTACSQKPVFTFEVLKTPTSSPAPVELTSTATPLPFPTLVPTETVLSNFSPILYGEKYDANTFFVLLGGWQGDRWLAPDSAVGYFANPQGWEYDVYSLAKDKFQVHGDPPQFSPADKIYTVGTDATVDEFGMVAVVHGWPVLQRDVHELSPDNEVYQQAALDWLTAQGLSTPELGTLHVFRVDLEGDGADEIFIGATHLENQHMVKPGDYSVILMRRVQGSEVITLPVVAEIYRSQETTLPRTYSLGNFLDLNQDGVLEIVVDIQRWEGDGAVLYQIMGQNIAQVP
jgi:hypothetical protein